MAAVVHDDGLVASAGAQSAAARAGEARIVLPTRRSPNAAAAVLPELPARALDVSPITLEVVTRRTPRQGPASTERQTITRTTRLIHVVTDRTEWLFERNQVDPRRVSALLVHHPSRAIVLHDESDLRNTLGVAGWADVLMLGVDASVVNRLTPSPQSRALAGMRFRRYATRGDGPGLAEVWWNQEQLLLLAATIRDAAGVTTVTVERLEAGADPALLRPPPARFPDYKVIDLAEWLEGH
jgi:hypothetical protein